jgi:Bardet-Biedl syndrome 4 protein
MYICIHRLDDFENACAAYDKSIELGAGWPAHLNYAAYLLRNDEAEKARQHLGAYEELLRGVIDAFEHDTECMACAEALRKALY